MNKLKRLPVGIQTFEKIVNGDFLYVDKTEYIWNMTHLSQYVFLSRPRRFGKSLLVSTLQAYFEGKKELFKGLAIEQLEKEWVEYPVLRFDMSPCPQSRNEMLASQNRISCKFADRDCSVENMIISYCENNRPLE